jgi:hypothetical protein
MLNSNVLCASGQPAASAQVRYAEAQTQLPRDAVFARDLRCRPGGPRRLRHDPKLLVPAPAPPPLNRRGIVTIGIVR